MPSTVCRRTRRALEHLVRKQAVPLLAESEDLVLLTDGMWSTFRGKYWVLYDMAVKPIGCDVAWFLDPLLLPGKENMEGWKRAVGTIPVGIRRHVRALVSDGLRGSKGIARSNRWVHQLCHYHLLSKLHDMMGRVQSRVAGREARRVLVRAVSEALVTTDSGRLDLIEELICILAEHQDYTERLRGIAREFLRDLGLYRNYLSHPELRLPRTTSTLESMHSQLRRVVQSVNSPSALLLRVRAYIRLHPTIACNGPRNQQK